ncbi:hypothetical protein LA080_011928 [Diaporthe eres]|uniref:Uncharacterized protein n=1 Tax=Diaporthe vaccinii TaxID=105482 RepID=A0ABR4DY87_9PEZI|nr:hypothetical protein LA080_011928 [Diaporthe eres]
MPKNRPNCHERNKAKAAEAAQQHQEDIEMQMNVDNAAEHDLAIQPAIQPTSTLFLDFGGSTDDGQQFVTSLLKCESLEAVAEWGKENTGSWDATDQALNAIEATSAGEYASKTAGSIGTVNFQLQRHEHEIMVNEHMGNENKIAIDQMREDIKTERGNVRACQKFVADFEKDLKTLQKDVKTVQNDFKALQNNVEAMQEEFSIFRRATEVHSENVQEQLEMMNQENKIQSLVLQSLAKSVTGKDDEETKQWINQLHLEAVQL